MSNKFEIAIVGVDRATAAVKNVNKAIGSVTRPIADLGNATKALGKEAGLDRVGAGFVKLGRAVGGVGDKLFNLVAPLTAVTGITSIAGIATLTTEWGLLGAEIGRTAGTIGISTDRLQSLRGAATLAGVSSEALTSGLKTLGDTMEDAVFGRNAQAAAMMNTLHIGLHHTATGAVDTARALGEIANQIARVKNPQVQAVMARTFGIEELLPLLRRGSAGIAELESRMRSFGAVMTPAAIAAGDQFRMSLLDTKFAVVGLENVIGEKLLPVVSPMIEGVGRWIAANRELIGTNVAQFVGAFGQALKGVDWAGVGQSVRGLGHDVKGVVDLFGGWKNAAIGLGIALNAGLILDIGKLVVAIGKVGLAADAVLGTFTGLGTTLAPLASFATMIAALYSGVGQVGKIITLPTGDQGYLDPNTGQFIQTGGATAAAVPAGRAAIPALPGPDDGLQFMSPAMAGNARSTATPYTVPTPYTAPTPAAAPQPSSAPAGSAGGEALVTILFANAPPGMTARTSSTGSVRVRALIHSTLPADGRSP